MILPLKSTIYTIYLAVFVALLILLSQGVRQYQLYQEHEAIIARTESLIFQFSIIREHASEALLEDQQAKLFSGISSEMEKLNTNLTAILNEKNIGDEYKLTFLNSIDLPGIILLLKKIESGSGGIENIRNLNSEMRTLGERLILFDRLLVNNAKKKLIGFQNIIIGTATFVVFLLVTVLTLFHRQLIVPLLQLISKSSDAASGQNSSIELNSPSKELTNLTGTIADLLGQRSELQMQLQNSRQTFLELVTAQKGFFAVISPSGKIIDISGNIAEKCGFSPEELAGRQWHDFFCTPRNIADTKISEAQFLEDLTTGQIFHLSLATKNQTPSFYVRCSFIKYPTGSTESYLIYCLGLDMSEEQAKIEELEQCLAAEKNKKAEMVRVSHLAVLGELSTGVAHEVSNLSNGIINYAQVLADAACDPDFEIERDKLFKKIIVEGEKIAGLAKNLLAYGQDDAESKELAPIEDILQNSLNLMSHYFKIDGTALETNFNTTLPYRTNGRQMQQVFLNILNNARRALNERYTQKDGNKILRVSTSEIEKNGKKIIRLIFTDFGIGISAENLKKVFEPSFSTKPASEGIGLGLTVSRELVAQHQGEIYLDSQLNDHTTVTVELPVN